MKKVLLFLLILSIKCLAADVQITGKQEHRQDAYLTIQSSEKMDQIKIYKQITEQKYILFYKSTPKTTKAVCRISAKLLSEEKETHIKVVVEHGNGEVTVADTTIDKIEKIVSMNPAETEKPSWTPTVIPTKPTPSIHPSEVPGPSGAGEITGIKLNKNSVTLKLGQTDKLTYTVTPEGAHPHLVWRTDANEICSIEADGTIKGVSLGKAQISIKADNGVMDICDVTVVEETSPSPSSSAAPSNSVNPSASEPTNHPDQSQDPGNAEEHQYKEKGSVVKTYKDETISVSIEKIGDFYVSKIWVKDSSSQIKKASGNWGKELVTVKNMLNKSQGAIVGCNGSGFYKKGSWEPGSKSPIRKLAWDLTTEGHLVITDGNILRQIEGYKTNALIGILPSGGFKYYEASNYSDVIGDGVKNTFTFGPMLIYNKDGYKQSEGTPRFGDMTSKHYRCCLGQIDSNNYIILSSKAEVSLNQCATMGKKLDCNMLYNLDGGGSTTLWFRDKTSGEGELVRNSSRPVGDAVYFTSGK